MNKALPRRSLIITLWVFLHWSCCTQALLAADADNVFVLSASEWNIPRTPEAILSMPALQQTMQAYSKTEHAKIQIRYPGGDEGTLWANELRSWFISLGVASRYIELLPGSPDPGQVELRVTAVPKRN